MHPYNIIVNIIDEDGNLIKDYPVPVMENCPHEKDNGLAYFIVPLQCLPEIGYLEVTFKQDKNSEYYEPLVARSRQLSLESYREENERKA